MAPKMTIQAYDGCKLTTLLTMPSDPVKFLRRRCEIMQRLIRNHGKFTLSPDKRRSPFEALVQAINRPTRDTALSFINAWTDTRQTRQPESRAYAVLNDIEQPVSVNVIDAFRNYQIRPVPWRDRAQVVPELAA